MPRIVSLTYSSLFHEKLLLARTSFYSETNIKTKFRIYLNELHEF